MSADLGRMPLLSIIYVNYRSARVLSLSIRSLAASLNGVPAEIIVVNNDPSERLILERLSAHHSLILFHSQNVGFAAGANIGAKIARGDILFFLNPDTEILSGDFPHMLEFCLKEKHIGALGAILISEKGTEEKGSFGRRASLLRSILAKLPFFSNRQAHRIEWVSGGALFTPRVVFESLSGFDERFFLYFEDMDYCARATRFGKKIDRIDCFRVKHRGGESFSKRREQKFRYYESQERFYCKNGHRISALIFSILRNLYA